MSYDNDSQLRRFDDIDATRTAIYDRVKTAFESKFPMESDKVRIEASNFQYNPAKMSYGTPQMKKALMEEGKLATPLYADLKMIDVKTGETIDERKKHLVANVPWLTGRGTFIMKGTEYTVSSQTRLRPGIYARTRENGEIEAHINPRRGIPMRMYMEPQSGIFRMKVGQANLRLYPLLRSMGMTDEQLKAKWGDWVWEQNSKKPDPRTLDKFYEKVIGGREARMAKRLGMEEEEDTEE